MALVLPQGIYPSQQVGAETVHAALLNYLSEPYKQEPQVVSIVGGAGAGKSWTTINSLLPTVISTLAEPEYAAYRYMTVSMTTTTHQANSVIDEELANAGFDSVSVSTLHSFLQLIPWTGTCTSNPPQFRDCGYKLTAIPNSTPAIVFVDEAYRICPNLWAIMQYLRPYVLWICTYDACQTPPVGYSSSPIDDLDVPKATLIESPRFVNSGELAKLVTELRKTVSESNPDYVNIFSKFKDKAYTYADRKEYGTIVRDAVTNNEVLPPHTLMVCGTRKQACKYNNAIHKLRKAANLDIFKENDPILVEYVIGSQDTPLVSTIRRERKFTAEMVVPEVIPNVLKKFPYAYRYASTSIYIVPMFDATTPPPYRLWKDCAKDGVIIIGIRLNYARTVHTAQGMTVPNVYVDLSSIFAWSNHDMRRRLLYTGASRCSGTLKVVE